MKSIRLHPSLLVVPALLAFTPPATEEVKLAFGPAPDTTVHKSMTSEFEALLDDMSILVDGQDLGAMLGAFELTMFVESELEMTDTYLAVADGRPTELKRTFETLASNTSMDVASEMGGETQDIPASSVLEGATVVYTWDPEMEEYVVRYEEEDAGDEDLLIGLIEDFDMRTLLPDRPVEVGDSWKVDSEALAALAMQAQSLHIVPDEMDEEAMEMMEQFMSGDFMEKLEDLYDGDMTMTLKGVRDVDGEQHAGVEIDVELSSSMDMMDMILEAIATAAETAGEEMPPIDFAAADLNIDFEGEGVMVWNLTKGLFSSMETSGDFNFAVDIAGSIEEAGESMAFDVSVEMSGMMETTSKVD